MYWQKIYLNILNYMYIDRSLYNVKVAVCLLNDFLFFVWVKCFDRKSDFISDI